MTTSIVARTGWIMPAPLAIPPTVNPPALACASFGPESVVRMASAAASPPSAESRAAADETPASTRSSGRRTPITPVERTTTASLTIPSASPTATAVASASASPAAPVAAFATPALTTTACGSASREVTTGHEHRRRLHAVGRPERGTDRGPRRADECDVGLARGADPGGDAGRLEPPCCGDRHRRPRRGSRRAGGP